MSKHKTTLLMVVPFNKYLQCYVGGATGGSHDGLL